MVMNSGETLLAVLGPLPIWLNFLAMAAAVLLVAAGGLIWLVKFRKRRKRKYRSRHPHEPLKHNPTLAESGGLPPARDPGQPPTGL
jgi:hypothetical protein